MKMLNPILLFVLTALLCAQTDLVVNGVSVKAKDVKTGSMGIKAVLLAPVTIPIQGASFTFRNGTAIELWDSSRNIKSGTLDADTSVTIGGQIFVFKGGTDAWFSSMGSSTKQNSYVSAAVLLKDTPLTIGGYTVSAQANSRIKLGTSGMIEEAVLAGFPMQVGSLSIQVGDGSRVIANRDGIRSVYAGQKSLTLVKLFGYGIPVSEVEIEPSSSWVKSVRLPSASKMKIAKAVFTVGSIYFQRDNTIDYITTSAAGSASVQGKALAYKYGTKIFVNADGTSAATDKAALTAASAPQAKEDTVPMGAVKADEYTEAPSNPEKASASSPGKNVQPQTVAVNFNCYANSIKPLKDAGDTVNGKNARLRIKYHLSEGTPIYEETIPLTMKGSKGYERYEGTFTKVLKLDPTAVVEAEIAITTAKGKFIKASMAARNSGPNARENYKYRYETFHFVYGEDAAYVWPKQGEEVSCFIRFEGGAGSYQAKAAGDEIILNTAKRADVDFTVYTASGSVLTNVKVSISPSGFTSTGAATITCKEGEKLQFKAVTKTKNGASVVSKGEAVVWTRESAAAANRKANVIARMSQDTYVK